MMTGLPLPSPARPFFLPRDSGQRFCLYHAPHPARRFRGTVLHVHPFAEEMNRARRVAAIQARAFAAMGFGVLQIDLHGCGDSSGLHGEASWDGWKQDLLAASAWLARQAGGPRMLWGVRLGALLALDFARNSGVAWDALLLWQPVLDGRTYLTQFLRLRLAAEIAAPSSGRKSSVNDLRARLAAGESVEVAGYELTSALTQPIDQLDSSALNLPGPVIHWMEVVGDAAGSLPAPPPSRGEPARLWAGKGIDVHLHAVPGAPFWSIQENVECPALIEASGRLFSEEQAPA